MSLSREYSTVKQYTHDIGCFLATAGTQHAGQLRAINIVKHLASLKADGKADATLNRAYMAIRSFCRYLKRVKALNEDITEFVAPPQNHQKAPIIPTLEEVARILEAPDESSEAGCRDKAILELLYSSGLRASELCDLELADVSSTSVTVKCGKRGKTRTVPLTANASQAIQRYIEQHRGKEPGCLFVTLGNKQLRRQYLAVLVQQYASQAGLNGVTTHSLRHACATHLLEEGADIRMIQEVLGHASIATTQRYTHLSSQKLDDMFHQFHPRRSDGRV